MTKEVYDLEECRDALFLSDSIQCYTANDPGGLSCCVLGVACNKLRSKVQWWWAPFSVRRLGIRIKGNSTP